MPDSVYAQNEIFAAVRLLLKKCRTESTILFGAYARQEADAASDIDLIVIGAYGYSLHCGGSAAHLGKIRGCVRTAGTQCRLCVS